MHLVTIGNSDDLESCTRSFSNASLSHLILQTAVQQLTRFYVWQGM